MHVNTYSVHFSCQEVFQLLHDHDEQLWEQVLDLLKTTADELYSLTPVVGGKRGSSVIGNGNMFDDAGVFWSNEYDE